MGCQILLVSRKHCCSPTNVHVHTSPTGREGMGLSCTSMTFLKKSPYTSGPSWPRHATRCPRRAAVIMKLEAPPTSHISLGGGAAVNCASSSARTTAGKHVYPSLWSQHYYALKVSANKHMPGCLLVKRR